MFQNKITGFLTAILLAGALALVVISGAQASPAAPGEFILTQPDGTAFTARLWGDEWNNGVETPDGYSILQEADGWWAYAALQPDGTLGPAWVNGERQLVGLRSPAGLTPHVRATVVNENPHSLAARGLTAPSTDAPQAPAAVTGLKTLLLFAKFSDTAETYTAASFQALMFSTTSSSVRKYYREVSYNKLDILPAEETCGTANDGAAEWVNLGYNHPNPGSSFTTDNQQIVRDVLTANNGCINYALFDTSGDGYIDASELVIVVVVAGYERSYSVASPSVWAHQWYLNDVVPPSLDGKVIGYYPYGGYAQFGERHGAHQATIGIMAHEFGHTINWPDLYDTTPTPVPDSEGVGNWSIMGSGNWNKTSVDGDSPAHPDAWLKWYQGWIEPTRVYGQAHDVQIARAEDHASAYLLRPNPDGVDWLFNAHSGSGEFFLVENRQLTLYDSGLPGCGLLIWHVDESVISDNTANGNENHALVWLEQADGLNELAGVVDRGDSGDPWPGSTAKYLFYEYSTPNSNLYSGFPGNVTIAIDSTSCGSSMQADLTYGAINERNFLPLLAVSGVPGAFNKLAPINAAPSASITPTLDWADAPGATGYEYCYDGTVNSSCTGSWVSTGMASQVTLPTLSYNTSYEWQVRATNALGTTYADGGAVWSFTTVGIWTVVTREDFEGSFPRVGWTAIDGSMYDGGEYLIGKRNCNVRSGGYSGWLIGGGANGSALACGSSYLTSHNSWLVYGPFSTTTATAGYLYYDFYVNSETNYDNFYVLVADEDYTFWGDVRSGSWSWQSGWLNLDDPWCSGNTHSCLGLPEVYVAFVFDSDGATNYPYGALIDNIVLQICETGYCPYSSPGQGQPPTFTRAIRDFLHPFQVQFSGIGAPQFPH